MSKYWYICFKIIPSFITGVFMFIPDSVFGQTKVLSFIPDNVSVVTVNKILTAIILCVVLGIIIALYLKMVRKISIKRKNYIIQVEYGDLKKVKNCQKVISFDECYTKNIGRAPSDIKPESICGQYLKVNPNLDIDRLIKDNNIKPLNSKSKFMDKERYSSGTIVPNGNDLLLAFAKLDKNGRGTFFSYQEFLDCLEKLWGEIDKYFAQMDVCIPILGSGQTRINNNLLTQQELLDIIIHSYQLSNHKVKRPYKLRIICKKIDGFSLNKIDNSI